MRSIVPAQAVSNSEPIAPTDLSHTKRYSTARLGADQQQVQQEHDYENKAGKRHNQWMRRANSGTRLLTLVEASP